MPAGRTTLQDGPARSGNPGGNPYNYMNRQQPSAPGTIRMSSSAETNLANVQRAQQEEYETVYRPLNREIIDSVDSRDIIKSARKNADYSIGKDMARLERNNRRMGVSTDRAADKQNKYAMTAGKNLTAVNTLNNAVGAQYDRNTRVRDEMINVGRNVQDSAMSSLSQAAQTETQIRNTNESISAQNSAARDSTIGQIAGMGVMLAIGGF